MRGRIRSVKPEVHTDEDLWDLEQSTGLPVFRAFVGLWNYADREGRFEWRPRALKAVILPYWEGDMEAALDALAGSGFIHRYESGGRTYGYVQGFKKHQTPNAREPESTCPPPPATNLHVHARAPHVQESDQSHARISRAATVHVQESDQSQMRTEKKVTSGKGMGTEWEGNGTDQLASLAVGARALVREIDSNPQHHTSPGLEPAGQDQTCPLPAQKPVQETTQRANHISLATSVANVAKSLPAGNFEQVRATVRQEFARRFERAEGSMWTRASDPAVDTLTSWLLSTHGDQTANLARTLDTFFADAWCRSKHFDVGHLARHPGKYFEPRLAPSAAPETASELRARARDAFMRGDMAAVKTLNDRANELEAREVRSGKR